MTPEEALAQARAAAAGYPDEGPVSLTAAPATRLSAIRLAEWAMIEPDLDRVYSTRRFGAPITWAKLRLVHALRQYVGEGLALQSRYNALATMHIVNLEERVRHLEEQLGE